MILTYKYRIKDRRAKIALGHLRAAVAKAKGAE